MITSTEEEKIKQFRAILPPDLLTKERFEDDYYLIRWLRARNFDFEKAKLMLVNSMKWRKDNQADGIRDTEGIPKEHKKLFPSALLGRDHDEDLVLLYPMGRYRHRPVLENEGMETALRYNTIYMESLMQLVKQAEEESGKRGIRLVQIVDMEHYSYREFMYGPARDFLQRANKNFDENYPEMLKSMTIVNAPKVFTLLFNFLKVFLSKETLDKISIYGGGSVEEEEVWKRVIRSKCKPECVPIRWGGTRKGADEFCSENTDIWVGAPVPIQFFTNDQTCGDIDDCKTESIRAREKLQIEIAFNKANYPEGSELELQWKYKVDSHDISIKIVYSATGKDEETDEKEKVTIVEHTVSSKQGIQEGSYPCQWNSGIFTVTFDNRYSLARSKTVYHSLKVVPVDVDVAETLN